jgi:hypothetical protein
LLTPKEDLVFPRAYYDKTEGNEIETSDEWDGMAKAKSKKNPPAHNASGSYESLAGKAEHLVELNT